MKFFEELTQHLKDGEHINIAISKREGDKLVVSVAPVTVDSEKTKIRPLMLRGTSAEIDAGFLVEFDKLRLPLAEKGLVSNAEAVISDTAEEGAEEEKKEQKASATKTAKKAEKAKPTTKPAAPVAEPAVSVTDAKIKVDMDKAADFVEKKQFVDAIMILNSLNEKNPNDKHIGKALLNARTAKAKAELEEDDEPVNIPAKPAPVAKTAPVPAPVEEPVEEPEEEPVTDDDDDF